MANQKVRKLVSERAKGCCEYCMSQQAYSASPFSVEHIISKAKKGSNDLDNLAFSCQGCNNYKYTKQEYLDPNTQLQAKLFHPRRDNWQDHFKWNENFTVIIGLTPTGRATINALRLNRPFLINQRVIYRAYGVHPPIT